MWCPRAYDKLFEVTDIIADAFVHFSDIFIWWRTFLVTHEVHDDNEFTV